MSTMGTIDRIVEKAIPMAQEAKYQCGLLGRPEFEKTLHFAIHPDTKVAMAEEWIKYSPVTRLTLTASGLRQSNLVADHIWGIKMMEDPAVPVGEIELRAIVARSWS